MVGGDEKALAHFFEHTWQKQPFVYRETSKDNVDPENPLTKQVNMGLNGLINVLENACRKFLEPPKDDWQVTLPMVFDQNKQSIPLPELAKQYGNNLFGAYLEGCSVVLNHCDELCPNTAELCEDLQLSFPFAYANGYLTPPCSQAVPAHADDRDVFVIQVYGRKAWNVYEEVPIQYPYTHEQVGKNDFTVPPSVLDGPRSIETTLYPGDVLYIPRGHVHEACTYTNTQDHTTKEEPSFHITIALATFDWALTGVLNTAIQKTLDAQPEYRMAIPLDFGKEPNMEDISPVAIQSFEQQLDRAFSQMRKEITAQSINSFLGKKYQWHRRQARPARMKCFMESKKEVHDGYMNQGSQQNILLGLTAVKQLSMLSRIRSCTKEEREEILSISIPNGANNLREETRDILFSLLDVINENPLRIWHMSELTSYIETNLNPRKNLVCDLTLLSFIRSCLEDGKVGIVHSPLN